MSGASEPRATGDRPAESIWADEPPCLRELRRSNDDFEAEAAKVLAELQCNGQDRCILCGRKTALLIVWFPSSEEYPELAAILGDRPDTTGFIAYTLCRNCREQSDAQARAEAQVIRDAVAMKTQAAASSALPLPVVE